MNRPNSEYSSLEYELRKAKAENDRLRTALRKAPCPGGGFNGMPAGADPTIGLCLDHECCGCVYGDILKGDEQRARDND